MKAKKPRKPVISVMDRAVDAILNPEADPLPPKTTNMPSVRAKAAGKPPKTSREYDNPPRKPPKPRKPWMCKAKLRDPDWPGRLCEAPRRLGQEVCGSHGGAAPQAMKKAKERLAKLITVADGTLKDMLDQRQHLPTALNAVKEVYDRVEGPVKGGPGGGGGLEVRVGFLLGGSEPATVGVQIGSGDPDTIPGEVVEDGSHLLTDVAELPSAHPEEE